MVWGYIQMGVPGRSVRWIVTLIVAKTDYCLPVHSQLQEGSDFSTGWSSLPFLRFTMKFLRGKKIKVLQGWPAQSPDMNIIDHIWERMKEEAWRTKPKNEGGALGCLQGGLPCHPRRLHQQALRLPNRMATVLQAKGTHTRY